MSQEGSRRRDKLATTSTRIGTNDSMRALPKVDKKKSKRLMNYEVSQDLYIKDKLKMAEETLVRMEKSKVLWGELVRFFDKMHQGFKIIAASAASVDETLLALSKLYSGELQETLLDIVATRSTITAQFQICANAIMDSFVLDVAYSMDPFLKELAKKTKEVEKDGLILKNQMIGAEKSLGKMKDRNPNINQTEIQEHMKKFTAFKAENDIGKARILEGVLLMEKERVSYLISSFNKVVIEEMKLGEMMCSQKAKMERWQSFSDNKELSGLQTEALAATRTLRDISEIRNSALLTPRAQPTFGQNEKNSNDSLKKTSSTPSISSLSSSGGKGWSSVRASVREPEKEQSKPVPGEETQQPEIIATCEEILGDMKSCAIALEGFLKNLDGLESNAFIDEINRILSTEELKKSENLIWEYEDYTTDYPKCFQEKKYFIKKQYFKKSITAMKERLNQLLEEELQIIQEEYANELGLNNPRYNMDSTFSGDPLNDYDYT